MLGVENRAAGAFPGPGWNWLGWGYNGSTALYQWERLFVRNTQPVGSVRVGGLAAFADALPLFEGFMIPSMLLRRHVLEYLSRSQAL